MDPDHDARTRQLLLAAMTPHIAMALLNGFYKPTLHAMGPTWYWLADAAQFVLVPLACAVFLLRPAGIQLADVGLRISRGRHAFTWDDPVAMVFVAGLLLAMTWPIGKLIWHFGWAYADPLLTAHVLPMAFGPRLLAAVYAAATAALVEELMFRALPWLYLRRRWPGQSHRAAYVIGSAVVFGLAHAEQGIAGILATTWFGLVAARTYLKHGTLWPCVLGHFAYDLIAFGPW